MREHGQAKCQTFGQVLWITVSGGVNQEFSESYRDLVIEEATPLIDKPWIRVTDIRHWELGGPEIIPALHELMRWCEQHNMAHSINLVSLKNLQLHLLDKMMAGIERHSQRHVVESPEQAAELLAALQHPLALPEVCRQLYPDMTDQN